MKLFLSRSNLQMNVLRIISIALFIIILLPAQGTPRVQGYLSNISIKEGNDYATQIFGNPWNMSEFSDISTYLNRSGTADLMRDINVSNGIFSGRSVDPIAAFTVLFPGYLNGLLVGKVGHNYPIDAKKYHCISVAAYVNTQPSAQLDEMFFWWFADERLNGAGGTWGGGAFQLYDSASNPNPRWKLYQWDLNKAVGNGVGTGTAWQNAPNGQWQGLQIAPSIQKTNWQIDWVRLTDCNPSGHIISIDWNGSGSASLSIQPENTTRDILVDDHVTSQPYPFNTEGIQPGKYTYFLRQGSKVLTSGSFNVVQAPEFVFESPSVTSGEDYASQAGISWDMDPSSVTQVECSNYSFKNSLLILDTPSAETQPAPCYGGGAGNASINLTTPKPVDTNQYRYATIHIYTAGPWQTVPNGMVMRWIWYYQGTSGLPDNRCWLISYTIPLDVGWHTYTFDLWDPIQGSAGDSSKIECPPKPWNWRSASPVVNLHIKPNENITHSVLHQELDWVKLTKEDQVKKGSTFNVQLSVNKPMLPSQFALFYTTDRSTPFMHMANVPIENQLSSTQLPFRIFFPIESNPIGIQTASQLIDLKWSTAGVAPGKYYLCAKANDGFNENTFCSEAPIRVQP